MDIITSVAEMRVWREQIEHVGLVPTMGALHKGHLSLIEECSRRTGKVVVSVFVNPAQFAPGEDIERYPRTLERDCQLAAACGADVLFAPMNEEIYDRDHQTWVEVADLSQVLCGKSRPGHFRGVATVVTKLLSIIRPHVAVFGQKDAQQLLIIRRLVRDLNFDTEIISCPTVREENNLAMSSRNQYLTDTDRQAAAVLYQALCAGRILIERGTTDADAVRTELQRVLMSEPLVHTIDYADVRVVPTLERASKCAGDILLAVAAHTGPARLIDNIALRVQGGEVTEITV